MKKRRWKGLSILVAVAMCISVLYVAPAAAFAEGEQPVTGITVSASGGVLEVVEGETLQMTAEVLPEDATDKTVTWSMENGTGEATIDENGLLTGTSAGTVTVRATANDGSAVYGEAAVTVVASPVFAQGDGTEETPYVIETPAQLAQLATLVNEGNTDYNDKSYKLAGNIDLSAYSNWTPIGLDQAHAFEGTFDGDGHVISHLTIDIESALTVYAGLFGYNQGTISTVGIDASNIDVKVSGTDCEAYVGGIAGYNRYGELSNCYNNGGVRAKSDKDLSYAGGISGGSTGGLIENCHNTGCVNANATEFFSKAGGIVAIIFSETTVSHCYNTGSIGGIYNGSQAGGIVGSVMDPATVINCYNLGNVRGHDIGGGIVGSGDYVTVSNCNNEGSISSHTTGGIIGFNLKGTIYDCYNLNDNYGDYVGGIAGCNYKGTIERCYNTGDQTASSSNGDASTGGIVGGNQDGEVTNCYNTGNVAASSSNYYSYSGGIVGRNEDAVNNCYNVGSVSEVNNGRSYSGGIIGKNISGSISNAYYLNTISRGIGSGSGTTYSKTTEEMKLQNTFAGFDFASVWVMESDSAMQLPQLRAVPHKIVTVQFDAQGETVSPQSKQVAVGMPVNELPTPEGGRAGYSFAGWWTDENGGGVQYTASTVNTNATDFILYARWTNVYTLTFNPMGGTVSPVSKQVTYDGAVGTLPTPTRNGYTFGGWYTGINGIGTQYTAETVYNTAGNTSLYAKWIQNPAVPASVKAVSASYISIKISWGNVSGASKYEIYRATSGTGTYSLIAGTQSTSFTNTGLTTGKTYYFKVRAYKTADSGKAYSAYSAAVSAKPIPATPTSVKAVRASSSTIKVSWGTVSGATKYEIYRAASSTGAYSYVKSTSATSFTNTGLKKGKTYYYKVRAYHSEAGTKVYGLFSAVVYAKTY